MRVAKKRGNLTSNVKRLHRRLSRTQKKSQNRKKARQKGAKAYLKFSRQREDYIPTRAVHHIASYSEIDTIEEHLRAQAAHEEVRLGSPRKSIIRLVCEDFRGDPSRTSCIPTIRKSLFPLTFSAKLAILPLSLAPN